jgi:hypothetical protein
VESVANSEALKLIHNHLTMLFEAPSSREKKSTQVVIFGLGKSAKARLVA